MKNYTAVIPVAGSGTRLRPHTYTYPKVLLRVGDKPILGHIVDKLIESGIRRMCFVIGYLGNKVKDYIKNNYPDIESFFVVQEKQMGLGHAVWLTRECVDGPVIIVLGDTLIDTDIKTFLSGEFAKIGVKEVGDPQRFGIIVKDENGFVKDMIEKPENPPTNIAIAGIYSFPQSSDLYNAIDEIIKSDIKTKGEYQLTDAMKIMIKNGHKIFAQSINGWYDCGKPQTLLETNRYILSLKKFSCSVEGSVIIPPVYISPLAKIKSSIIGPFVSVGDNVEIENSIISSSIINEGASIKNLSLSQSIIGPDALLEGKSYSFNVGENSEIKITEE